MFVSNDSRRTHTWASGQIYWPAPKNLAGYGPSKSAARQKDIDWTSLLVAKGSRRIPWPQSAERPRRNISYCRVSSQAQRPDLKNERKIVEEFCIAKGIANVEFIEEIGGGLNFKRLKFLSLVDSVVAGEVAILIVAHKDRLVRFGFDLIRHLCGKQSCELLLLNTEQVSPEQEMVQDLMAITHCFHLDCTDCETIARRSRRR